MFHVYSRLLTLSSENIYKNFLNRSYITVNFRKYKFSRKIFYKQYDNKEYENNQILYNFVYDSFGPNVKNNGDEEAKPTHP